MGAAEKVNRALANIHLGWKIVMPFVHNSTCFLFYVSGMPVYVLPMIHADRRQWLEAWPADYCRMNHCLVVPSTSPYACILTFKSSYINIHET